MREALPLAALLLTVLAAGFATGCGKRTPDPSSAEVRDLVLQIVRNEYLDQVSAACYKQISGIPIDVLGMKVDHAWLVEKAKTEQAAKKTLQTVDEAMAKVQVTLENVRTDKVDKEVGRIECSADAKVADATDPITFTAQYNDKGELYVEVFGLGGR